MAKHAAWAAAISSSGLVPGVFSKRVSNVYGTFFSAPLGAFRVPVPLLRSPFQTAVALRIMGPPFECDLEAMEDTPSRALAPALPERALDGVAVESPADEQRIQPLAAHPGVEARVASFDLAQHAARECHFVGVALLLGQPRAGGRGIRRRDA